MGVLDLFGGVVMEEPLEIQQEHWQLKALMGGILVAPHDEVLDQLQPPVRDYSGCNGISVQDHFYSAVHKLRKKQQ